MLLLVGMITVFIILSLVVLTGRILIRVINRYFSEEEKINYAYKVPYIDEEIIARKKLAVLAAAVEVATGGKGRITEIKKV